jgi:hypothetical protein
MVPRLKTTVGNTDGQGARDYFEVKLTFKIDAVTGNVSKFASRTVRFGENSAL